MPKNAKINAEYCIEYVLKPICEKHIPEIYGSEASKVFVHHDAASSQTSKKTCQYVEDLKTRLGITIIHNSEIPVKSPDTSPMDFFGFGVLKQYLRKRRAKTIAGLWKILNQIWNNVPPEMVTNVLKAWKRRLRRVSQRHGEHIENTSSIHRRKINA